MTPEVNMKMDENSYLYRSQKKEDGGSYGEKKSSW